MRVGGEEHHARITPPDAQLDPALTAVEGLVGHHAKSELLGIERQRHVLVAAGNSDELHASDHLVLQW
jgi:hypothetical protein